MSRHTAAHRGFSLVELMIALVIGTILLAGLVQIFGASRSAYATAEGLSRTQENGRFAMDVLQRDLRLAGHFGCVNDQARLLENANQFTLSYANAGTEAAYDTQAWPLRFHISLQGYEANGTAPGGAVALPAIPAVAGAAAGGNWTPALPADLAARAVPGSDVVVLRYIVPESVTIDAITVGLAPTITFDAARWPILASGVAAPGLFAVTDCSNVTIFPGNRALVPGNQVVATNAGAAIGFREIYEPGRATLHRAESVAYYIGIGASGEPALMRCRATTTAAGCVQEELVEGVENMQLVYGVSRVANGRPTGYIQDVRTAAVIGDPVANAAARANWRLVGVTQVGFVVRSPNQAQAEARANPFSSLGVAVTPPNDRRVRAAYENTVALRNRLFGN
ncbi:PilW family protein [Arenimonas sp.]|uniref:PilW family protein n=1 Tax=Arenimonas sp. TaxID=1872635 RepID=UPI0025C252AE|nr:PilW family protein [Arenimonas sp.]